MIHIFNSFYELQLELSLINKFIYYISPKCYMSYSTFVLKCLGEYRNKVLHFVANLVILHFHPIYI